MAGGGGSAGGEGLSMQQSALRSGKYLPPPPPPRDTYVTLQGSPSATRPKTTRAQNQCRDRAVLFMSCYWTVFVDLHYFLTSMLFTGLTGSIPKITSVSYTILLFFTSGFYVSRALTYVRQIASACKNCPSFKGVGASRLRGQQ